MGDEDGCSRKGVRVLAGLLVGAGGSVAWVWVWAGDLRCRHRRLVLVMMAAYVVVSATGATAWSGGGIRTLGSCGGSGAEDGRALNPSGVLLRDVSG